MKRIARWGLGSLATALVLITVAHLPPVAGWLGWSHHGGSGTCPFGYGAPAAPGAVAQADHARDAKEVLGFSLGRTTRVDVQRWALAHAVLCYAAHGGHELACGNAPGTSLGGLDARTVWFDFAADDTLASMRAVREAPTADALAAAFRSANAGARAAASSEPVKTTGTGDAASLARGALSQASAEYRAGSFHAELRATNVGAHGYLLTETYAI